MINLIIGTVGILVIFTMVFVVQYTFENMTFKQALQSSITIMCVGILFAGLYYVINHGVDGICNCALNITK